jgi:hypothetical protein
LQVNPLTGLSDATGELRHYSIQTADIDGDAAELMARLGGCKPALVMDGAVKPIRRSDAIG